MTWRLVPGSSGGHGLTVLGLGRHEWGDLHFWCAVVCVAATVVHMLLNWAWLKRIATSGHLWRLFAGLGLGIAIIFGIFFLPMERSSNESDRSVRAKVENLQGESSAPPQESRNGPRSGRGGYKP